MPWSALLPGWEIMNARWANWLTTRRSAFYAKAGSPLKTEGMEDAKRVESIGILRGGKQKLLLGWQNRRRKRCGKRDLFRKAGNGRG